MRANLDAQRGYVLAEPAMLALAARIGKHRAHELVHRAALAGLEAGMTLEEALAADAEIAAALPRDELASCCARDALGAAGATVDAMLERARAAMSSGTRGDAGRRGERARASGAASRPLPGYLGADARVRSGPAPELVAAGYELELADAPLLHRGFGLADLAHTLSLAQDGAIPAADARALLGALLELRTPRRDRRRALRRPRQRARARARAARRATPPGWLNAGRPRREAGRIAFRIALRDRLLVTRSGDAAARERARPTRPRRERDTPMPDYTYLQAAQPTTAGHWLLSFAYPALRDARADRGDFASASTAARPAPAASTARASPLDRERLATCSGSTRRSSTRATRCGRPTA